MTSGSALGIAAGPIITGTLMIVTPVALRSVLQLEKTLQVILGHMLQRFKTSNALYGVARDRLETWKNLASSEVRQRIVANYTGESNASEHIKKVTVSRTVVQDGIMLLRQALRMWKNEHCARIDEEDFYFDMLPRRSRTSSTHPRETVHRKCAFSRQ
jgi:hypothetical protein